MNEKIKIAIFGGSGYGGSELLRILLFHPNAEIVLVTANEHAGKAVGEVHKNLFGLTDLRFGKSPEDLSALENIDLAFFALPHGQALNLIPHLPPNVKVIDLSGDFRIDDKDIFKEFYKLEHTADVLQKQFVYGLTETNREQIKTANYVANPGCFATATLLALAPLVKSGLLTGKIIVDAKTGSSGSGRKGGGEHASSAENEFVLRLQTFSASTRSRNRTAFENGRRIRQSIRFYDAFTARFARDFRVLLPGNRFGNDE